MEKKSAQKLIKQINKGDPLPELPDIEHPEPFIRFQQDTKVQLGLRRGIVIGLTMALDLEASSSTSTNKPKKGGNSS